MRQLPNKSLVLTHANYCVLVFAITPMPTLNLFHKKDKHWKSSKMVTKQSAPFFRLHTEWITTMKSSGTEIRSERSSPSIQKKRKWPQYMSTRKENSTCLWREPPISWSVLAPVMLTETEAFQKSIKISSNNWTKPSIASLQAASELFSSLIKRLKQFLKSGVKLRRISLSWEW